MGSTSYIASSQTTGLAPFDIKFMGEQVMYELGLQEAMAHYAGDDPLQGSQEWMDTQKLIVSKRRVVTTG